MRRQAVLADTGPLHASVDPNDPYHERAQREGRRLASEGNTVIVAYPTLFESYNLVSQRLCVRTAHAFLTELRERSGFLAPTGEDDASACVVPARFADQDLSLFDALLSILSTRLGLPSGRSTATSTSPAPTSGVDRHSFIGPPMSFPASGRYTL